MPNLFAGAASIDYGSDGDDDSDDSDDDDEDDDEDDSSEKKEKKKESLQEGVYWLEVNDRLKQIWVDLYMTSLEFGSEENVYCVIFEVRIKKGGELDRRG